MRKSVPSVKTIKRMSKIPGLRGLAELYKDRKALYMRDDFIKGLGNVIPELDSMLPLDEYGSSKEAIYHSYISLALNDEFVKKPPLFTCVEIETINRCNGTCSFCPASRLTDKRPLQEMSDEMFESIISQLKDINYSSGVSLYSNNEPLLDKKIVERVTYTRKQLPNARMALYTNGILLTVDKLLAIIDSLDRLVIDNYSKDNTLNEPVKKIDVFLKEHEEYRSKVDIKMELVDAVRYTRGGDAPNAVEYKAGKIPCFFPFCQVVIRPNGQLSLCCNDPMGRYTMGDLTKEKLVDIWYGSEYQRVRNILYTQGRQGLPKCDSCNHYGKQYVRRYLQSKKAEISQ